MRLLAFLTGYALSLLLYPLWLMWVAHEIRVLVACDGGNEGQWIDELEQRLTG